MSDNGFSREAINRIFGKHEQPAPPPPGDEAAEDEATRNFLHQLFNKTD